MHPYLTRLGVRPQVQAFFAPYTLPGYNDLLFQQGDYREHFGLAFHRVQAAHDVWIGGEVDFALASHGYIAGSVMELIAFLHYHGHALPWGKCIFIATGNRLSNRQLCRIADRLNGKSVSLLFPADLLGAISDLKIAAALRRLPAAAFLAEKEKLSICFRAKVYEFEQRGFSLSVFEKASRYRFNVTTRKPKHGASFLDQLQAGAFPSLKSPAYGNCI